MADATFQHQMQDIRAERRRRQHHRVGRHHRRDRGCRVATLGQKPVGQVAGGEDADQPPVRPGDAKAGDPRGAHHPRRLGRGGIGRAGRRIAGHQVGDLLGGQIAGARLGAAATVEEPLEGGKAGDQAAKLGAGQQQQLARLGGAGAGRGQPVAHQPALAEGIARRQQRDEAAVAVADLDPAALDQEKPRQGGAEAIDLLALRKIPAAEATGDPRQFVLRQAVIGMDRFEETHDRGNRTVQNIHHRRSCPCPGLAGVRAPEKPGGTPLSCQVQCAVAAPAPFGTRMLSTRSWISTGGSSVALDTR